MDSTDIMRRARSIAVQVPVSLMQYYDAVYDAAVDEISAVEKEVRREALANLPEGFGEALHTYFRKYTDSPGAHRLWCAIRDLDNDEWHDALATAWKMSTGQEE